MLSLSKPAIEHVIPPITDPLGKYWDQPCRSEILIDDTHAVMSEKTFKELRDYSQSQPTGCYPGKMWRALSYEAYEIKEGEHKGKWRKGPTYGKWFLRWFGEHPDPKYCSNNSREIILL